MKYFFFLLSLLLSEISIGQNSLWKEYPVNCDTTVIFPVSFTSGGLYVGKISSTNEFVSSVDKGQSWQPFCSYDDFKFTVTSLKHDPNVDIIYAGKNYLNKYNLDSQSCERIFSDYSIKEILSAVILETGQIVVLTSEGSINFYDSEGNLQKSIFYSSNLRIPKLYTAKDQKTFVSNYSLFENESYLQEINISDQTLNSESVVIPDLVGVSFTYNQGHFFSAYAHSVDYGKSWNKYEIQSNETISSFTIKDNEIFILGIENLFYSSNRGDSFNSIKHNLEITFDSKIEITQSDLLIHNKSQFWAYMYSSSDLGLTWRAIDLLDIIPQGGLLEVGKDEKILSRNQCRRQMYNSTNQSWEDYVFEFGIRGVKVLENDNLLTSECYSYRVSSDFGDSWNYYEYETPVPECFLVNIKLKENVVYVPANYDLQVFDGQMNFLFHCRHSKLNTLEPELFDYFADRFAIGVYKPFFSDDVWLLTDLVLESEVELNKKYDPLTHIDIATAWSGDEVYILEYLDETESQLLLQKSEDKGFNFTPIQLPFSTFGSYFKINTDHNGNIIIHSNLEIWISQDKANSWINLTPMLNEMRGIMEINTSFDDYLYVSTIGTGVLRYECKLNTDLRDVCFFDLDGDGAYTNIDCDDSNPNINPYEIEITYNGIDDDCDQATLDDDLDQDGYPLITDCDDTNAEINPGQTEIPFNALDDDCNSATLDDDADQDGFAMTSDCDDNDPNISPGQTEIAYNGIDDDCNSATLDDDLDQDGYPLSTDCDDNNPNTNPGEMEGVYNGIDDDCNPATLDDDLDQDGYPLATDCDDNDSNSNPGQTENVYNGIDDDCDPMTLDDDLDQDGFLLALDCDDENANVNPDQAEQPYNGFDDDCNGATLDDDLDQDGFLLIDDCDDNNPFVNPNAEEIPNNGIDEDCDGMDLLSALHELGFSSIKIYPNPALNEINIEVMGSLNYKFSLFDIEGKLLQTGYNQNAVQLSDLAPSIYLLEIQDLKTGQRVVEKIIKAR